MFFIAKDIGIVFLLTEIVSLPFIKLFTISPGFSFSAIPLPFSIVNRTPKTIETSETIRTKKTKETTGTKNKREKAGTTGFSAKRNSGYPARLPFCIMSSFAEPACGRQGCGGQSKKGGDVTKIPKK